MITSSSSLPEPALLPGAPPGCWAKADGLAAISAAAAAARISNGFILDLPLVVICLVRVSVAPARHPMLDLIARSVRSARTARSPVLYLGNKLVYLMYTIWKRDEPIATGRSVWA